ncbi:MULTISPECIES: STM4012 family radical SAM protein [Rhizobium]|uniref:Oxygen-independent coproporphyrinogen-3 oxidase n=3 Tax=Rhizobium TaxID=379 RepID=A0A6P1CE85_RHITR|nr:MULTISPECIES: STM4012 family radical SAM protein [Rhizobium]AGB73501.1 coproporphyrinogen III oxidase family protein [Rhizobium tropici CIAT 899]ENN84760.1 coproporphyrinogen III oxidase family protein [Rhizobium freirei PRF 81]MBB4244880.1 oxygen-independent coproporphyrinogen-3 oxidase [Rhizobium tropici]MBB5596267.1 oxygen-independent coproporphyrinogen-3 oxidase [Rhizobium tropici]MBB6488248.1 oxygen-independent coproporphyrinogen-3 oxidase [Rhizobium lusitanum]
MQSFANSLREAIGKGDLKAYVYSYPPKRTYKELENIRLSDVWDSNDQAPVALYIHVPFCRYRCTYCTLFLTTRHTEDLIRRYVEKICWQISLYATFAGHRSVASVYIGGGTPTLLPIDRLAQIFSSVRDGFPNIDRSTEVCVEGSPDTVSGELLDFLKNQGVNRISMGIQTMDSVELRASGRPYQVSVSISSIEAVRKRFDNFNLDLIYGLFRQTPESWKRSLEQILSFRPTTVSLYPAISRPLTAMQKQQRSRPQEYVEDRLKYEIYDSNVDFMQDNEYRQESFTRFTCLPEGTSAYGQETSDFLGVPMIGIGAGARSYNGKYHYSLDYAVALKNVGKAIDDYIHLEMTSRNLLKYGVILDESEERLRYFILNLTLNQLSEADYSRRFGRDLRADFLEVIDALEVEGCIDLRGDGAIALTRKGYKYSNLIAHHLFSDHVKIREERYVPK